MRAGWMRTDIRQIPGHRNRRNNLFVADADGENLSRCPDKGTQGYAGKYPEGLSVFRCGGGIRVLGEIIKKVAITMQFLLWGKLHGECPYV